MDEEMFLANYSDQLSDFPLPKLIEFHKKNDMTASFVCARPSHSFHSLNVDAQGFVTGFRSAADAKW